MSAMKAKIEKKRRSGIPTGNAGEYFVMGELLRRGFDAQLADRNTKGYDLVVGRTDEGDLKRVQVKTVRRPPWYVKSASFRKPNLEQVTIYVLVGTEDGRQPVRYFIAKNKQLVRRVHLPKGWNDNGFMPLKAVEAFEGHWEIVAT